MELAFLYQTTVCRIVEQDGILFFGVLAAKVFPPPPLQSISWHLLAVVPVLMPPLGKKWVGNC